MLLVQVLPTLNKKNRLGALFVYLGILAFSHFAYAEASNVNSPDVDIYPTLRKADAGDASAQFNLAAAYRNGYGVAKNQALAMKWLLMAGENHHPEAEYLLGLTYDLGDNGVPRNYKKAYKWYYLSALEHQSQPAETALGRMYEFGHGVALDYKKAAEWYRYAAENFYPDAQAYLGMLYVEGKGVPQDNAEAFKWIEQAAKQNNSVAQCELGIMFAEGKGVPPDIAQGFVWLLKSADQGLALAQNLVGRAYHDGNGVQRDDVQAAKWWRKAAEQGYARAQYALGVSYFFGIGQARDSRQAYTWMTLAAAQGNEKAIRYIPTIAKSMTPDQIAEAERRASEWKPTRETNDSLAAVIVTAMNSQIGHCWDVPKILTKEQVVPVGVLLTLNRDRTISDAQVIDDSRLSHDQNFKIVADSALQALNKPECKKLNLPPDAYETWKQMTFTFDARTLGE